MPAAICHVVSGPAASYTPWMMGRVRSLLILAASALVTAGHLPVVLAQQEGASIVPPSFASPSQSQLYERMSSRLIAPCCWGEAVRLHQSPAAAKVRAELISYVRAGLTDGDIRDRFAREYGERILGQPRGIRSVVAYAIPPIFCALGILALSSFLSRRNRVAQPVVGMPVGVLPDLPDLD